GIWDMGYGIYGRSSRAKASRAVTSIGIKYRCHHHFYHHSSRCCRPSRQISNAARNANKPFVELSAVSAVRVMEAVEALTGWPVPEHLLHRTPPPLVFLPPLDEDPTGSAEALNLLTGGRSLPEYILCQSGSGLPAPLLRELDRTDLYDSRDELLPVNPQEREAARQRPVSRPYMERSRQARQQLLKEQLQRRAEAEGIVPW
ncbi:hypothetical protein Vafri_166, partial [Volvox africanus]